VVVQLPVGCNSAVGAGFEGFYPPWKLTAEAPENRGFQENLEIPSLETTHF